MRGCQRAAANGVWGSVKQVSKSSLLSNLSKFQADQGTDAHVFNRSLSVSFHGFHALTRNAFSLDTEKNRKLIQELSIT